MDPVLANLISSPVASTILVITLLTSLRAFKEPALMEKFLFIPLRVYHNKEYSRLFTSGLIHANTPHLAFNMLTFFFFAFILERQLGHWQFAVFYVLSLALSEVTTLFKYKDSPHYRALGASGAVSAVVMGIIMIFPLEKIYLMFIPIGIPNWLFGILYIAYSHYASRKNSDNIGHEAHLWGAISGILLTIIFKEGVISNIMRLLGF
ncbi:MAG: rhomboid family intramembrane serine protease [Bacteroidota bacterium]